MERFGSCVIVPRAALGHGGVQRTFDVSLSGEEGGFGGSVEEIKDGSDGRKRLMCCGLRMSWVWIMRWRYGGSDNSMRMSYV